ncbi:MAG: hypothetical protein BWY91_01144 [bacterium ADurb.BinA028]|nr:MAG: hypothetical protein BWY91_01144 [bacterium ADurb.BinA028]
MLPSVTCCDGGAIVPEGVPTLDVTVCIAGPLTVRLTGTTTSSVPLPGPGFGSLLVTQRLAP